MMYIFAFVHLHIWHLHICTFTHLHIVKHLHINKGRPFTHLHICTFAYWQKCTFNSVYV